MPVDDGEHACVAAVANVPSEAKLKLGITVAGFGLGPMAEASVNGCRPTGLAWTLIAPIADTLEKGRADPPTSHGQS